MSTVKDIYLYLDTLAPFSSAAPWDNTGLLVGNENSEVKKDSFSDVPAEHWAYKPINTLYEKGIINGVSATEFSPDTEITREEFLKLIVVLSGCEIESDSTVHFEDTDPDAWYYPYVSAAYNCGLTQGFVL